MQNIDLEALAAVVKAKFAEAFDSLTAINTDGLEQFVKDNRSAYFRSEPAETVENRRAYKIAGADYNLSDPLATAIDRVTRTIKNELANIERGAKERTQDIEAIEGDLVEWAERTARAANINAAKTAERIESDFCLVHTATADKGKGRNKIAEATIVFLFNGGAYRLSVDFDPKTRDLKSYPRNIDDLGYRVFGVRENATVDLFKAEMTAEEIGKTAHALDCIRAAFRSHINPQPVAA